MFLFSTQALWNPPRTLPEPLPWPILHHHQFSLQFLTKFVQIWDQKSINFGPKILQNLICVFDQFSRWILSWFLMKFHTPGIRKTFKIPVLFNVFSRFLHFCWTQIIIKKTTKNIDFWSPKMMKKSLKKHLKSWSKFNCIVW